MPIEGSTNMCFFPLRIAVFDLICGVHASISLITSTLPIFQRMNQVLHRSFAVLVFPQPFGPIILIALKASFRLFSSSSTILLIYSILNRTPLYTLLYLPMLFIQVRFVFFGTFVLLFSACLFCIFRHFCFAFFCMFILLFSVHSLFSALFTFLLTITSKSSFLNEKRVKIYSPFTLYL